MKKIFYLITILTLATSCKKEVISTPHYIGEIFGGGIIVDVNRDSKGKSTD